MAKRESLAKNTFMLYLLTFSNYFFGFITTPYLTRVLGVETYGVIGFATSFAMIVQMVLDFGFQLSGVIDIANNQHDREKLKHIVTSVTIAKLWLILPGFIIVLALTVFIERFRHDPMLFALYFLYAAINALVPDFFYRGMEYMTTVTIRNVAIKTVFAMLVVLTVKRPEQYILVPFFYCIGSLAGLFIVLYHMKTVMRVWFVKVSFDEVFCQFKRSAFFFVSRAASSVNTSFNTIMIGILYPTGPNVGYYSTCNTAINAGIQAINPISGSLFPHIVRTKDFALLKRVLIIGEAILIGGCMIASIQAPFLCSLVFGSEYYDAGYMLRILLPLIPINLVSYLCGWAGLSALGKEDIANKSVLAGAVVQLLSISILYVNGVLDKYFLCYISVLTEFVVCFIRVIVMLSEIHKQKV